MSPDADLRALERAARVDPVAAVRLRRERRRAGLELRRVRIQGWGGHEDYPAWSAALARSGVNGMTGRVIREAGNGSTFAAVLLDEPWTHRDGTQVTELLCEAHELVDLDGDA